MDLDQISAGLARWECSIIQALLERILHGPAAHLYQLSESQAAEEGKLAKSQLGIFIYEQETLARRYGYFARQDIQAFFPVELDSDPKQLVSINTNLLIDYVEFIAQAALFKDSSLMAGLKSNSFAILKSDYHLLGLLSRRIHCGARLVAQAKYLLNRGLWQSHIDAQDFSYLRRQLIRPQVERQIKERVRIKAKRIFSALLSEEESKDISIEKFVLLNHNLYEELVIPLTIEGELDFLIMNYTSRGRESD